MVGGGSPFPGPTGSGYGYGVAYGGGKWVAVGHSDTDENILCSTNGGVSWDVTYMTGGGKPFDGGIVFGVGYGGGSSWVAVGDDFGVGENILYSTNGGVSWNVAYMSGGGSPFAGPAGYAGRDAAYGGGKWIAVGRSDDDKNIIYSTNGGVSWDTAYMTGGGIPFPNLGGYSVSYNGSSWVATGYDTNHEDILYSSDGISWDVAYMEDGGVLFPGGDNYGGRGVANNGDLSVNSGASMQSRDVINYIPGLGSLARFTCVFGTGTNNYDQYVGIGDGNDGFFFGYNGENFGTLNINNNTKTWTAQSSWSVDKLDGTGNSGITLNPNKLNQYEIELKTEQVNFSVNDPDTGKFILVDRLNSKLNDSTSLFSRNMNLPLLANIEEETGGTGITNIGISVASMGVFVEGENKLMGTINSYLASVSNFTNSSYGFIFLQNKATFNSITNRTRVYLKNITCANDNSHLITIKLWILILLLIQVL